MGSEDGTANGLRRPRQPVSGRTVACAVASAALVICGVIFARAERDTLDGRWEVVLPVSVGDRRRSNAEDVHKLLESTEKTLDDKMGEHVRQMQASVEKQLERIEQLITRGKDGKPMGDVPESPGRHRLHTGSSSPLQSAASLEPINPAVVTLPRLPEPLPNILPARSEDYWPFTRNENYKIATAKPSHRHPKYDDVAPFQMYVHDPTICRFVSGEILQKGAWEPGLTSRLLQKLGPAANGRVFLDIGANIGWFSLAAAAAGHRVIAIDALRTNVELFLRSLEENPSLKPLVEVFHYAVSSSSGGVAVMRPAPLGAPRVNKANGQVQFGPEREAAALREKDVAHTEQVNVTTIDSIVGASQHLRRDPAARIDVVKLDVEGFETRALLGAMMLLDQHKPCLIVSEFVQRHITSTTAGRMIHDLLMSEGYKVNGKMPTPDHNLGERDIDITAVHTHPRCSWA
jgi:FkbM family methyltransferase